MKATSVSRLRGFNARFWVLIAALFLILVSGCTQPMEKSKTNGKESTPRTEAEKQGLTGTWVSEKHPEQRHVFANEKVTYRERQYSVVLEENSTYTLTKDGSVTWTITWYSGNKTTWNGKLKGDRMSVQIVNSWDETPEEDTLVKAGEAE
jgi:hypothetical protein